MTELYTQFQEEIRFLYLPALIICGVFFCTAGLLKHPRLRKWMRISAISWLIGLWVVFSLLIYANETCTGNMIYGYGSCTVISTSVANLSLSVVFLSVVAAIIYAIILMLVAGIVEWRHRRRIASTHTTR